MDKKIPFNHAGLVGSEFQYIGQAITHGQIMGDGSFSHRCHALLAEVLRVPRVLLTTSGTHALEMGALLLNTKPGDKVIVPSFTFVSTVNAFVLRGARPVFIDCRADTLNMGAAKLEALLTPRTKAILPVHYAAVGCEMDTILEIAQRHSILVIEDNAHGLFAKYRGRYLGTVGCLATQSFHETKNVTCGEGGALLINDERYVDRAEILREKGTDRSRFYSGQVDKYSWVDIGASYVLADILAAFLFGQLEKWQEIQQRRKVLWETYDRGLATWPDRNDVRRPVVPAHCEQLIICITSCCPHSACGRT